MQFAKEDKVALNARNIYQLYPSKKLLNKYLGHFKVLQVVGNYEQIYKLNLPPHTTYTIYSIYPY
jgi:hypothetical protein